MPSGNAALSVPYIITIMLHIDWMHQVQDLLCNKQLQISFHKLKDSFISSQGFYLDEWPVYKLSSSSLTRSYEVVLQSGKASSKLFVTMCGPPFTISHYTQHSHTANIVYLIFTTPNFFSAPLVSNNTLTKKMLNQSGESMLKGLHRKVLVEWTQKATLPIHRGKGKKLVYPCMSQLFCQSKMIRIKMQCTTKNMESDLVQSWVFFLSWLAFMWQKHSVD